jgi:hypothetical protein
MIEVVHYRYGFSRFGCVKSTIFILAVMCNRERVEVGSMNQVNRPMDWYIMLLDLSQETT